MAASSETKVMKKRDPALANSIPRDIAVMSSGRCALSEIPKGRRRHPEILGQGNFPEAADQRDQRIMMHGVGHRIHHFPPKSGRGGRRRGIVVGYLAARLDRPLELSRAEEAGGVAKIAG